MTIKKVSKMITFEKEGMKEALQGTSFGLRRAEQWFSDYYSPHFYLGEWFPVLLWHDENELTFFGKEWNIIRLDKRDRLSISKGVRLR